MKKILILFLTIVFVFTISIPCFASNVFITVDGEYKYPATPATIIDGSTMVPVRFIAELFGCEVIWDANSQTVAIISKEAVEFRNKITLAEFEAISVGMTYEQVVNIVGSSGIKESEYVYEFLGYTSTRYEWEGTSEYGSASITFHNNIVDSKSQYGLE